MSRELLQARCDPDTVEGVEQYAEDKEISRSESMRRLLRAGLQAKGDEGDRDGRATLQQTATIQQIGYTLLVVVAFVAGMYVPL